jgi:restriction system protein
LPASATTVRMSGPESLPTYLELMLPTLRAVEDLGGSGSAKEIRDRVIELLAPTEAQLGLTYDKRPKSILIDRMDWARSYLKLAGALERLSRLFAQRDQVGADWVSRRRR